MQSSKEPTEYSQCEEEVVPSRMSTVSRSRLGTAQSRRSQSISAGDYEDESQVLIAVSVTSRNVSPQRVTQGDHEDDESQLVTGVSMTSRNVSPYTVTDDGHIGRTNGIETELKDKSITMEKRDSYSEITDKSITVQMSPDDPEILVSKDSKLHKSEIIRSVTTALNGKVGTKLDQIKPKISESKAKKKVGKGKKKKSVQQKEAIPEVDPKELQEQYCLLHQQEKAEQAAYNARQAAMFNEWKKDPVKEGAMVFIHDEYNEDEQDMKEGHREGGEIEVMQSDAEVVGDKRSVTQSVVNVTLSNQSSRSDVKYLEFDGEKVTEAEYKRRVVLLDEELLAIWEEAWGTSHDLVVV